MFKRSIDSIQAAFHFLAVGIWRIRLREQPLARGMLIKHARMLILAIRGFDEDKCQLRASALTYYTLLSIVPIAAMAFGIAKGFGFEKVLERELLNGFPNHTEVIEQVIEFSRNMLDDTRGGLITGIGIAVLLWTVIKVLGNIEKSFNDIWGIKSHRSLGRRFGDYLSVVLVAPILILLSSGITVFINTQIDVLSERNDLFAAAGAMIRFGLKFVPYFLIWSLFSFMYVFMPNQKVRLLSGVIAGIIAGTIYQLTQFAYIYSQVGVSKYGAIYGSFAALPLFLLWLQISWLIVLFGAEISFAHQNVDTYEFEPDCAEASPAFRKLLALRLVQLAVARFAGGETPLAADELAHRMGVPIRLTRELLHELVEARILSEVRDGEGRESAYQPGLDPENLTIHGILDRLDHRGSEAIPVTHTPEIDRLSEALRALGEAVKDSPQNLRLRDL
jgi:membrane protein